MNGKQIYKLIGRFSFFLAIMGMVIFIIRKGEDFTQVKDTITLISSFTALTLSLVNFVFKDKITKISLYTNRKIILVKGNPPTLHIPLTFINTGVTTVVEKCILTCTQKSTSTVMKFKWDSLCEDKGGSWTKGKEICPILIKEQDGISETITFVSEDDGVKIEEGEYELEICVWVSGQKSVHTKKKYKFKCNNEFEEIPHNGNYETQLEEK